MGLSPTADLIWEMCDEYVAVALQHLCLRGPYPDKSTEGTFDFRPESLCVRFLFPGIAEPGFNALVGLRELRWRLGQTQKGDRLEQSPASAHSSEQLEAMFESKCQEIENLLREFSEVQREILNEKFLKVT